MMPQINPTLAMILVLVGFYLVYAVCLYTFQHAIMFPGMRTLEGVEPPDLPDGAEIEVQVSLFGPDAQAPEVSLLTARAQVMEGRARVDAALSYPYDARVPGAYRYVAEASWRGSRVRTTRPATYTLRPWFPFS